MSKVNLKVNPVQEAKVHKQPGDFESTTTCMPECENVSLSKFSTSLDPLLPTNFAKHSCKNCTSASALHLALGEGSVATVAMVSQCLHIAHNDMCIVHAVHHVQCGADCQVN